MEQENLTVYERALLFLYQARLESIGIKAELRVVRPNEERNGQADGCESA